MLERVDELGDLAGDLETFFICAELFVLGGEPRVVFDDRHERIVQKPYCSNAMSWVPGGDVSRRG